MLINNPRTTLDLKNQSIRHVAIIMDGNGRWATLKGKLRVMGHKAGVNSVRRAVRFAVKHKIEVLTLYAFSSENWKRPAQEVVSLMKLFVWTLENELIRLHQHNIRLCIIGDISNFNTLLQDRIRQAEGLTKKNTGLILNIAANYGGRWDIIHGIRKIATLVQKGIIQPDQIDESVFSKYLCLNDLAPVDLVIRTGGEYRISNFLLWQIAYTELYFTEVLWPDFDEQVFEGALNAFSQRERRFGNIAALHHYNSTE
ncbi:MAG: (2E,6E)-farnesyl-diphosphate-specific ditrans,polycis-undecaprenyl-diphosphate synthase [Candidatus Dasytiphilus stammeri]